MKKPNFKIKTKIKKSILIITIDYDPIFIKSILFGFLISFAFIITPSLAKKTPTPTLAENIQVNYDIPTSINIPVIDLEMPIKSATVSANNWQVYDDAVSHLNTSGDLKSGNIVLYAHNQKNAFGKIIQMGVGNQIVLKSENKEKIYEVTDIFTAAPQDTYLLEDTDKNTLTMYTCSGWFDKDRFFVIAKSIN